MDAARRFAGALAVLIALVLLLPASQAGAQEITGTITGIVRDQSGGAIPGVTVRVRNVGTNATLVLVTDESGVYTAPLLPIGRYEVTAELEVFKKFVRVAISKNKEHSGRNDLSSHLPKLVSIALMILPLLSYWQVQNFEFINMDDPLYITDNPLVRNGLTREGIMWAFTFNDLSYWHPLTWLSHMVDCHVYWLNPKGHHLTNVVFHMGSTLLLFLTMKGMTGGLWRSALVAALFGLHPLNVESVAWVANRKNILSAFFWILAMWSYAHYARKPNGSRYRDDHPLLG